jgi:hypothetical protein
MITAKKLKRKKCKGCKKLFLPARLLQYVCSGPCATAYVNAKEIEDKEKGKKKTKQPTAKSVETKLWKVFSEFIRRRDAKKFSGGDIGKCITCSHTGHWKTMDCGHGISRKHQATKYDEKNNHLQCKGCNGFKSGKQFEYMLEVDKKYGKGTAELLLIRSKIAVKRGAFEFGILLNEYVNKLKNL